MSSVLTYEEPRSSAPGRKRRGLTRTVAVIVIVSMVGGGLAVAAVRQRAAKPDATSATGDPRFRAAFETATRDFQKRTEAVKNEARSAVGKGTDKLIAVYGSMGEAIHGAVETYSRLAPPAALKPVMAQLVQNLQAQEKSVADIVSAAEANDGARLIAALQTLAGQMSEWVKTRNQLSPVSDPAQA